jgi:Zinc finger, C3HC4 type (RING finger)
MVKNTYYPIQDCLVICQEYDQAEAAFLLNKKLGKYFDAVKLGIQIIKTKVDLRKLKVELYFAIKKDISLNFPVHQDFMVETTCFDSIFKQILKICRKNSKEVEHDKEELVWYIVIDTLMELKGNDCVAFKSFCRNFF